MKISLNKVQTIPHTAEISASSSITKQTQCLKPGGNKLENVDQMADQFQKMMEFLMRLLEMLVDGVSKAANGAAATGAAASASVSKGVSGGGMSNQFLWKPSSEKDGKLVVLLPANITGKVSSIEVKGPGGATIEKGKFSGVHNGGREHFRFSKPGASFPAGSVVNIHLKDGSTKTISIPNTGSRVIK